MPTNVGVRRVFTAASLAAVALLAQGTGALAAGTADLTLTMTGPATATAGTNITYLFTITNNGPEAADGVFFSPVPPANTTEVSPPFQTSGPQRSTSVPAGTIYTFTWVLRVNPAAPAGTVITNTLTITTTTALPTPAHNSATVLTTVGAGAQAPDDGDGRVGDDGGQGGKADHGDRDSRVGDDGGQGGNADHGDDSRGERAD
ncbi:MAG TPA: hypothetical protein VGU71_13950 [Candidatus Dormibacteraeota bacterium]|nr:hypothetical protein [Candidatus Dormibacteraeota bacterium]